MTIDRITIAPSEAGMARSVPEPAARRRFPGPIVLMGGFLAAAVWGINARVWMRFIATDPDFTWTGTLFIVIGFGVAGLAQAGAHLGRRSGLRRPWMTVRRVITFAGLLPLGMAAGGMVFPTVVLAPLAITHTEWPRWVRSLIGVLALFPVGFVAWLLLDEHSVPHAAVAFVWFLAVYAGIVWAARFTLAPQRDGWRAPRAARVVGAIGVGVGVLASVVLVAGLSA